MNLLGENIEEQLWLQLRPHLREQLWEQVRYQLWGQLWEQLWSDQLWAMINRIQERLDELVG